MFPAVSKTVVSSHFINNVFSMMRCLNNRNRKEQLDRVLIHLSRIFHYQQGEEGAVSPADEIDFLLHYLELQSIRFGDRLRYSITGHAAAENRIDKYSIFRIVDEIIEKTIEPSVYSGKIEIALKDNISISFTCGTKRRQFSVENYDKMR